MCFEFIFPSLFVARPGMFNIKDRAKWDAWKLAEGMVISLKSKHFAVSRFFLYIYIFL